MTAARRRGRAALAFTLAIMSGVPAGARAFDSSGANDTTPGAAAALATPLEARPSSFPPQPLAPWFLGIALGVSGADVGHRGGATEFGPVAANVPLPTSGALRLGAVLRPGLLVGAELSAAYATNGASSTKTAATGSLLAVATWFPADAARPDPLAHETKRRGPFLRAGIGGAALHAETSDASTDAVVSSWTGTGGGVLAGGGYALWLGDHRDMTFGLDWVGQWYGRSDAGSSWASWWTLSAAIDFY